MPKPKTDPPADPNPEPTDPPADPTDPPAPDPEVFDREYVEKLRKESAKYRTERNEGKERVETLEKQLQSISKALGLDDDSDPDPDNLVKQLNEANGKFRQERIRNAYLTAAAQQGADIDLTWHVLVGEGTFSDLDIEADDFAAQVASAVKTAVDQNPKLKAAPSGPGSGDQGPRGGTSQLTRDDLQDMTPDEIEKAREEGRLKKLMGVST